MAPSMLCHFQEIPSISSYSASPARQRITKKPIALVRGTIEVGVVFFGWLLGGTAGLGTTIFALGIGPAVDIGIYFVNKNFK